jgi:hypothetical protein
MDLRAAISSEAGGTTPRALSTFLKPRSQVRFLPGAPKPRPRIATRTPTVSVGSPGAAQLRAQRGTRRTATQRDVKDAGRGNGVVTAAWTPGWPSSCAASDTGPAGTRGRSHAGAISCTSHAVPNAIPLSSSVGVDSRGFDQADTQGHRPGSRGGPQPTQTWGPSWRLPASRTARGRLVWRCLAS